MLRVQHENEDGSKEFSFAGSYTKPSNAIQWQGDLAYLPEPVARAIITKGYGRSLSDAEVGEYSKLIAGSEDNFEPSAKAENEQENRSTEATKEEEQPLSDAEVGDPPPSKPDTVNATEPEKETENG
jgi:hypothetical protein